MAGKPIVIRRDTIDVRNKKKVDEINENLFNSIIYCVTGTVTVELNLMDGGITDVSVSAKKKIIK